MKKEKFPISRKGETNYRETAFGIIGRSKLILLEIEGIKKAWDFTLQENSKGRTAITPLFLQKVHRVGFGWIFPTMAGKFRCIEVTVSEHTPPRFFERLIDLLAWAHHKFLWIHPFTDYNGRIGRLLINMILLNLNLPPIELQVETKTGRFQYIQALQKADNAHYEALKKLIQSSLEEAAKELA